MLDKLAMTLYEVPDAEYLDHQYGTSIDEYRRKFYKYSCQTESCFVQWKPHRFSDETNFGLPYTRIELNPKYFYSYGSMLNYIRGTVFGSDVPASAFNCSRIDIKGDLVGVSFDVVRARVHVTGFQQSSFHIYAGSTMYMGSSPKVRIYDKFKEIQARFKKGRELTKDEKVIMQEKTIMTRFEVELHNTKMSLEALASDPSALAVHFDRINLYDFEDAEKFLPQGAPLQFLMSKLNPKYRAQLKAFRSVDLEAAVKADYLKGVTAFFAGGDVPF